MKKSFKIPFANGQRGGSALRTGIAGVTAGSIVAGMVLLSAAAQPARATDSPVQQFKDLIPGSSAAPDPNTVPNLSNQSPAGSDSEKLNVTVGKSVVISTDPSGKPGVTAMLANTQYSGQGTRTVEVPMGGSARGTSSFSQPKEVNGSLIYDINSTSGQVENLGAQSTSYSAQLPVAVSVTTTVDGRPVAAQDMVNVSGFVELNYTFKNQTAKPMELSYRNPEGNTVTEVTPVAIPFAGSFSVTLPETFADVNAPWANAGQLPGGLLLSGTVEMIPPLGDLEQTLKITGRATNATLPGASLTAIPITLSNQKLGKLGLEYGPKVVDAAGTVYKYGTQGEALVAKVKVLLAKYGTLVEGYAARAEDIAKGIVDGAYDDEVNQLTTGFTQLNEGVEQLDQLLPQATAVIGTVNSLVNTGTDFLEDNLAEIDAAAASLNKLVQLINQYGAEVTAAADMILSLVTTENLATLEFLLTTFGGICAEYGTLAGTPGGISQIVENISDAVDDSTLSSGDKANAQDFLGPLALLGLVPQSTWETCALGAPAISDLIKENSAAIVAGAASLKSFIDNDLPKYVARLKQVNEIAQYAVANQDELLKKLDNNNCAKTPSTIKQCGLRQQINYLNGLMQVATKGVHDQMLPGTEKLASYVPVIDEYFDLVKTKYAPLAEEYLAMVPGAVTKFAEYLGIADLVAGDVTKYAGEGELRLAQIVASLEAMDQRAAAGEGLPAGPSQGADTNLGAYQYQISPAADNGRSSAILFGLAGLALLIGIGVGTWLYRARKG